MANFGRFRANLWSIPDKSGRMWPRSGRSWSVPSRIRSKLANSAQHRSNSKPNWASQLEVVLMWGTCEAKSPRIRPVSAPPRSTSTRFRSMLGEFDKKWPALGKTRPAFQGVANSTCLKDYVYSLKPPHIDTKPADNTDRLVHCVSRRVGRRAPREKSEERSGRT